MSLCCSNKAGKSKQLNNPHGLRLIKTNAQPEVKQYITFEDVLSVVNCFWLAGLKCEKYNVLSLRG